MSFALTHQYIGPSLNGQVFNSSPPGQNGCCFADNIFKCISVNEKFCILIKLSLKIVAKGPIDSTDLDNGDVTVLLTGWTSVSFKYKVDESI